MSGVTVYPPTTPAQRRMLRFCLETNRPVSYETMLWFYESTKGPADPNGGEYGRIGAAVRLLAALERGGFADAGQVTRAGRVAVGWSP